MRIIAFCLALVFAATPASAERAASPWARDSHSALRLVDYGGQGERWAALELQLDPGYKTYWRYPGDSGVPPILSFEGSENLAAHEVFFPTPHRFDDGAGGSAIGYTGEVKLVLKLTPKNPAEPVRVVISADYAVCERLCIPAKGMARLTIAPRSGEGKLLLAAVPAKEGAGFSARLLSFDDSVKPARVRVELRAPEGQVIDDVFAEGPGPAWALPLPKRETAAGQVATYDIALDGLPAKAVLHGASLRLTVTAGAKAAELRLTLP